jgi:hypothetical protein
MSYYYKQKAPTFPSTLLKLPPVILADFAGMRGFTLFL